MSSLSCLFCKIIRREIPASIVYENAKSIAFLDIFPLSKGHVLVIPKFHAEKMHQVPDEFLEDILVTSKKVVEAAIQCNLSDNYNVLQNNGKIAHQEIDHVHFHLIPKPSDSEGLKISWPSKEADKETLRLLHTLLAEKLKEESCRARE